MVLLQEGLLGLSLRVSDSEGLQQALRIPISNSFQVVLLLLGTAELLIQTIPKVPGTLLPYMCVHELRQFFGMEWTLQRRSNATGSIIMGHSTAKFKIRIPDLSNGLHCVGFF